MSLQISVDYDPDDQRLVVRCPIFANDLIRDLPSHRWSKSKRAWLVPLIRKNVQVLRSDKFKPYVQFTRGADDAMWKLDQAVIESINKTGFPRWYKFKTEPRKHQSQALAKLYGMSAAALFMDMQTGKSKTAIDLACAYRMEGKIEAVLILVKLSLRKNWRRQFDLHCPLPFEFYLPVTGKPRQFDDWLSLKHDFKVMVVGWESLSAGGMAEMCERYVRTHKCAIIGDETTYIAGPKAERAKRSVELARQAPVRMALTGTPIADGPMNLFMQFEFLDPNIIGIGDYYAFRNRYAIMGGYVPKDGPMKGKPTQIIGYQNIDELTETVAPYTFQVMKTDAYDLPPKRYEERTVELTKVQRELYQKIKKEGAYTLRGEPEVVLKNVLGVMLRLHQVVGGYAARAREVYHQNREGERIKKTVYEPVELVRPEENPKVIEIMATLEEMGKKKQGLIWAVYRPEIEALKWALRHMGLHFGELHGGIPEAQRQEMVDRFQSGGYQFVVGNASTGGMGYTMMASTVNMFYNNTFKLIDRIQAEDRAYGDGQTQQGTWIDYTAEKTVDGTILKALELKQDVADYVRERITFASKLMDGDA